MLQQNPEMVSAMMDNPMVQQALDNPGTYSCRRRTAFIPSLLARSHC